MEGWARFHRKIEEWEWYTDSNTFRLFFHLVLKANHADGNWRGQEVKRGQHITSIGKLGDALDLSPKQIRLALDKLKNTGEIETLGTNRNTVITVVNYGFYQDKEQEKGKPKGTQKANKGHTKGNKQEEEECKNENKTPLDLAIEDFKMHRKQMKAPMTDRAVTLFTNSLNKLATTDEEKIAVINQSIEHGWKGVFELKNKQSLNKPKLNIVQSDLKEYKHESIN